MAFGPSGRKLFFAQCKFSTLAMIEDKEMFDRFIWLVQMAFFVDTSLPTSGSLLYYCTYLPIFIWNGGAGQSSANRRLIFGECGYQKSMGLLNFCDFYFPTISVGSWSKCTKSEFIVRKGRFWYLGLKIFKGYMYT